jgi:transposase-like protein
MNQTRRAAREKWQQIIEAQRSSGQTATAYCRDHGITAASFFAWKRRLRPVAQTMEFVEVKTARAAEPADGDGIEVHLHGGRRLLLRRGFDRALLVEAIGALEGMT